MILFCGRTGKLSGIRVQRVQPVTISGVCRPS